MANSQMKNLVEGVHGHGAIHSPIKRFFRKRWRKLRGRHIVAKASVPFDWTTGVNTIDKIGGIQIKNQGSNYSCGRQAGAYAQYILRSLEGIKEGEISAKSGYGEYRASGGGMTLSSLETDIGAWGANLESAVPSYDVYGNPLPEYLMAETSWATPQVITEAFTRAGYTPFNVNIDRESIAFAISNYGFVIWMIRGQNNGTWRTNNPLPPNSNNLNQLWDHYMCVPIASVKNGQNTLTALNSWGKDVGTNGMQDFTDYIESGYILECVTFVKATKIVPDSNNQSIWANVTRFFRSLFGVGS